MKPFEVLDMSAKMMKISVDEIFITQMIYMELLNKLTLKGDSALETLILNKCSSLT